MLQNVFEKLSLPFVIAGKDPSPKLTRLVHDHPNTCMVANPSEKEMQDLVSKAQINILPSFNNTGVKLKLINALFNGRHCVVNEQGVAGTGLESACHIATDAASFQNIINDLYDKPFTEQEIENRIGLLKRKYDNETNAIRLVKMIWSQEV